MALQALLFESRKKLLEQLRSCADPEAVLLLTTLVLYSTVCALCLHLAVSVIRLVVLVCLCAFCFLSLLIFRLLFDCCCFVCFCFSCFCVALSYRFVGDAQATGHVVHAPSAALPGLVAALQPILTRDANEVFTVSLSALNGLVRLRKAGSIAEEVMGDAELAPGSPPSEEECVRVLVDNMERVRQLGLDFKDLEKE